jgi:hypothetical protein
MHSPTLFLSFPISSLTTTIEPRQQPCARVQERDALRGMHGRDVGGEFCETKNTYISTLRDEDATEAEIVGSRDRGRGWRVGRDRGIEGSWEVEVGRSERRAIEERERKKRHSRIPNAPPPTTNTDAASSTTRCLRLSHAMPLGFVPPYGACITTGLPFIAFASTQVELELEFGQEVEVQLKAHKSNGSGNRDPSAYTAYSKPKTPSFSTPSSGTARERVIEWGVRDRMVAWMNVDVHRGRFVEGPGLNMLSYGMTIDIQL